MKVIEIMHNNIPYKCKLIPSTVFKGETDGRVYAPNNGVCILSFSYITHMVNMDKLEEYICNLLEEK